MLHIILYAIVPIFAVMSAGYIAGRKGVFNPGDSKKFNKVVLDFALPSALFVSIVKASRETLVADLPLAGASTLAIMGCFMAVYYAFRLFKGNTGADAAISALISGSPSIGFLGFAVLQPIFGPTPSVGLTVAIVSIVVNAIGIPAGLSLINASFDRQNSGVRKPKLRHPVIKALCQPVAWAPLAAVIWVASGIPWPDCLSPAIDLMAQANASLAVFSAGVILSAIKIRIDLQVITGAVMKMAVMPGAALGCGLLFGLPPENVRMLVVACALPPAFSGIIIADEYNRYITPGTSSLTLSMLLFAAFCPLWLWLAGLATSTA